MLDLLLEEKTAIEEEFGQALEWLRLDEKRASIIRKTVHGCDPVDPESESEVIEHLLNLQDRFDKVFRVRLGRLAV